MESTKALDIKVGLFVAIGLALLLISILVIGGDKVFLASYVQYKGIATTTQGLNNGSVVSLSGIPVGNVKKIEFEPDSSSLILTMNIETKYSHRIKANSTFSIKTQGALGDKYIFIDPGTSESQPLKTGSFIIPSNKGDLLDVLSGKSQEFGKAADVVVEVHKLIASLNQDGRTAKLMENLVATSENLNEFIGNAKEALKELRDHKSKKSISSTLDHLASILKKVDNGDGTLGALINDSSLHNQLMSLVGDSPRNNYLKPLIRKSIQDRDKIQNIQE